MSPVPGILWVSSRLSSPTTLTPEHFCDWYENTHIQEVTALPGVPRAARYEAIIPQPSDTTWSSAAPYLTIYELPDLSYRHTPAFKSLDGQSPPSPNLLSTIFLQSRFDTRFYRQTQSFSLDPTSSTPAKLLISAALEPPPDAVAEHDFDAWYREEHIRVLSKVPGYVRTRRFEVEEASTLDGFVRGKLEVPRFLALHEFGGEDLPWEELGESAGTEWAKRVLGGLVREEVGWFGVKRVYGVY